ncbi:MAG: hypothetical protein ACTS73_08945 [Arsenophonus sp. NEOnobi-MAG3]
MSSDVETSLRLVIKHVQDALLKANTPSNYYMGDTIIREIMGRNDDCIIPFINNVKHVGAVEKAFEVSQNRLIGIVIQHIKQNYHGFYCIYLTGLGYKYLYPEFKTQCRRGSKQSKKLDTYSLLLLRHLLKWVNSNKRVRHKIFFVLIQIKINKLRRLLHILINLDKEKKRNDKEYDSFWV